MKRKILVSAIAIGALSGAGIAFAEGTSGQQKPEHEKTTQQEQEQTGTQADAQTAAEATEQKAMQTKRGVARLDSVRISALDEDSATKLQQKLQDLGYYTAEVDGKFGAKSRAALTQFFRDQSRLITQGRVPEIAMLSLGLEDSDIERVRGVDQGESEETERTPTRGTESESGTQSAPQKVEPGMEPRESQDMP